MIRFYSRLRILNKTLICVTLLCLGLPAKGQFRDDLDRRVARDLIKAFAASCALKSSAEYETMDQIKLELQDARKTKIPEIMKCFDTYFSQIQGVVFAFEKTCSEITSTIAMNISDNRMATQVMSMSKYEQGMRPYHSALNDCLLTVPNRRGRRYLVPLVSAGFSISELKHQLEIIEVKDPYVQSTEPYR